MMIANEWSEFDTEESGACYVWPSWNDRRGLLTITCRPGHFHARLQYRDAAVNKIHSDLFVTGVNEKQLHSNWLSLLGEIAATCVDMPEDYRNFIDAVSARVSAFTESGGRQAAR
jgi:hypothetical protein